MQNVNERFTKVRKIHMFRINHSEVIGILVETLNDSSSNFCEKDFFSFAVSILIKKKTIFSFFKKKFSFNSFVSKKPTF